MVPNFEEWPNYALSGDLPISGPYFPYPPSEATIYFVLQLCALIGVIIKVSQEAREPNWDTTLEWSELFCPGTERRTGTAGTVLQEQKRIFVSVKP